jgi:hypothetical protein
MRPTLSWPRPSSHPSLLERRVVFHLYARWATTTVLSALKLTKRQKDYIFLLRSLVVWQVHIIERKVMFLCRKEWTDFGPGPIFYALGPLEKSEVRYIEKTDPWYLQNAETAYRYIPHGGKRFRAARLLLSDRTRFVQIVSHSAWTGLDSNLSVDVLTGRGKESMLDMVALHGTIEMKRVDFNDWHRKHRQECYTSLLDAYFAVTTDLDLLARSEPDCSDETKRMIAERIAVYADPLRELLMDMMTAQLRGGFDGGTYKKAADGLIAAWDTTQAAIEAQTAFAIEQADKRVQAFLTGSDSA